MFESFNALVNAPMSEHTTLRLGGPADYLVFPRSAEEIIAMFAEGWAKGFEDMPLPTTSTVQPPSSDVSYGLFYYQNLGHIAKQSLETETRPSSRLAETNKSAQSATAAPSSKRRAIKPTTLTSLPPARAGQRNR